MPLSDRAAENLARDVARRGWFTARPDWVRRRRWHSIGGALFAAGTALVAVAAAYSHLALIPIPVAVAGLVVIGYGRWMPERTARGTDLARQLIGFRKYLTTTTAGPSRPAGQADLPDDYLPYAIVIGCTKQWPDLSMAVADANRPPSWYRRSGPYSPGGLSRPSRLDQFATATNEWITTHSTSGGSGSSGFSGGGGGGSR